MTEVQDLFQLLPAVHRVRDAEQGGVLEALLAVLAGQGAVVDRDIARLYDNWFVETCDPWVLAYIGDLLGVGGLHPVAPGTTSQRAHVANTLTRRRRKGTAAVLEQLAYDVTGWRAKAVEFFQLLSTTQYAKHVRPGNLRTPDLRDADGLDLLGGPFERAAHTVEVRRVASGRGRYDIPDVGLFLWRLQSYPIARGTARMVGSAGDGTFTFDPVGSDRPLFNQPRTEAAITDLAAEVDVPGPLRRRALFEELEAARQASVDGTTAALAYLDPAHPVLRVFTREAGSPPPPFQQVPAERILVADLSLWQRPPDQKAYRRPDSAIPQTRPIAVAVDPALGRLTFPADATPAEVEVGYAYGFSADMGGGPYDRTRFVDPAFVRRVGWQAGVTRAPDPGPGQVFATLADAVRQWNAQPAGTVGVIAIMDSRSYVENLTGTDRVELKEGSELLITAADWPVVDVGGVPTRRTGRFVPQQRRPHLLGNVSVAGTAGAASEVPGSLVLDGLLIEGGVTVLVGNLGGLTLSDCTVVPAKGGLTVNPSTTPATRNGLLQVSLDRTICGPVAVADTVPRVSVSGSIVEQGGAALAVDAAGSAATVESSTILGGAAARSLEASNSLFTGPLTVERRQVGCLRFCFVPQDPAGATPRRYRCQPDLALRDVDDPAQRDVVLDRMVPVFATRAYGRPDYAQLSAACPAEISAGAEDGAEMGAFRSLRQPKRRANLQASLDEYLRFGLEAGIFYVT